ncbi:NAD-dependent succinate-semialdehyde dehydrogenase [Actinopolymorpha alba]|uniref:NAD-dependent succinate-semialdehyde dehydrogenase n=1 Tax=Actinopolymorpha alba TaxID=533267 RepID=UPI00035E241A|nr:NAD-dependent succinate-semialdehyde dehydrogenase [Actinopolymorpha alba]
MTDQLQVRPAQKDAKEALASVPSGFLADSWRAPAPGGVLTVEDPATGEAIATVADCTEEDALAALGAAATAGPAWALTSPRERADTLHRLVASMHAHRERLAWLLTLEVGKTLAEARGEVDYAADYVRWYAEEAVRPHGRSTVAPDGRSHILTVAEPVGPCLLITPWNVPLAMAARKVAPALAAGCSAILKPAELTPLSSLVFAELALAAGVPAGVLTVVTTSAPAGVCARLIADERLRKVSFTGSTPVGRILLQQAGQRVLRVSMELGGNAPFLVFDDADLELAVHEAMIAKMRMGGQSCVAANRFLVQDGIADRFTAALAERMTAIRVGPGWEDGVDLGPLVDARAVAKAARLVEDARERGATVVARAPVPDGPGWYFPPTVLDHVPADAAICSEEVFGPVAAISRFSTEDEALARANDTEHGLAAYVLTSDFDRARRVAGRLQSGMVGINRGLVSNVAAPFGGIKQSGLGREGGPEGLHEYQQFKYLSMPGFHAPAGGA